MDHVQRTIPSVKPNAGASRTPTPRGRSSPSKVDELLKPQSCITHYVVHRFEMTVHLLEWNSMMRL